MWKSLSPRDGVPNIRGWRIGSRVSPSFHHHNRALVQIAEAGVIALRWRGMRGTPGNLGGTIAEEQSTVFQKNTYPAFGPLCESTGVDVLS